MNVTVNFNNIEYNLIYNKQSGYYEKELEATGIGGIYETKVNYKDLLEKEQTSIKKIQILAKNKQIETIEETLVYFLDKDTLEIKDVIEFENYEYIIDEETNKNTIFEVNKIINAQNSDIVVLKRNNNIDYVGKIEDIENENGENKRKLTLKYISNIFDRKIILTNENTISEIGIEDFIAKTIYDNFTNSEDELLNIKWLDVEVKTHTKIKKSVDNENGIYNFHTFITNCTQNYNIILNFIFIKNRMKLTIYKQEKETELIDTTVADISNYIEKFETRVIAKVVVKTDEDIQKWYLLSDRTTTQNKDDKNRAKGEIQTIYTQNKEDAYEVALNEFRSNRYNHYITFDINRNSKIFNVNNFKIGTPLSVRTNNNIVLDTYISAINDSEQNFISITCGNMRVNFIDKLLKERNK